MKYQGQDPSFEGSILLQGGLRRAHLHQTSGVMIALGLTMLVMSALAMAAAPGLLLGMLIGLALMLIGGKMRKRSKLELVVSQPNPAILLLTIHGRGRILAQHAWPFSFKFYLTRIPVRPDSSDSGLRKHFMILDPDGNSVLHVEQGLSISETHGWEKWQENPKWANAHLPEHSYAVSISEGVNMDRLKHLLTSYQDRYRLHKE
jgi:hypothetical protein